MLIEKISNANTSQSQWTDYSSLVKNNWTPEKKIFFTDASTDKLLDDLSLRKGNEHNVTWIVRHIPNADKSNVSYYMQSFNLQGGTIFAKGLLSPNAGRERSKFPQGELPELRHWSDVSFLMWQNLTQKDTALQMGLKRVVHCAISNPITRQVIFDVVGTAHVQYPGKKFEMKDGDHFAALLGTPNGRGTGWLLAEHKTQLGQKSVKSIQVFSEHLPEADNVYFLVLNVE